MHIENLKNKKILLFGKSRAFSNEELQMQLSSHNIELVYEYDDSIDVVVEGAMMTPPQTLKSEELYDKKAALFIRIDEFENIVSTSIDEDVLLMSLKLSGDKQRLKNFLTNSKISDEFYLKLIKMYDWGVDDFYESDDNRDVSASLIRRFYKNIERNHNVEFSKIGLMHLVNQTEDPNLLEVIASLKPLKKSFNLSDKDHGYRIVTSIATNFFTPNSVLKMFIKEANTYVKVLISMREFLDEEIQNNLYESAEQKVLESLAYCKNLSNELYEKLRDNDKYAMHMAKFIQLDKKRYNFFEEKYPTSLAQNESISVELQDELVNHHLDDIKEYLAANKSISVENIMELLKQKDEKVDFAIYSNPSTPQEILSMGYEDVSNHFALAHNESTPEDILREIYKDSNSNIHAVLAKNPSTPIDLLYQLQLDSRYERYVKENPSFGEYIQKENIGWMV